MIRTAILIVTFRRSEDLLRLLRQVRSIPAPPKVVLQVIVVDNDPAGSAKTVVETAVSEGSVWKINYVSDARPGVAHARNTAVIAAAGADFIIFVDDDERPSSEWVVELLRVQATTNADVVAGPVRPRFDDAPHWVVRSGVFERAEYLDTEPISLFGTGNVLLRRESLEPLMPPFDPRFGLTGGEDTHLALRLHHSGARMHYAARAIVEERLPRSRARPSWVLQRAFRTGALYTIAESAVQGRRRIRFLRAVKGAAHVTVGIGLIIALSLQGRAGVLRAAHRIATGAGMLMGLVRAPRDAYGHETVTL